MPSYEIPLSAEAQTFTISLGGADYNLSLLWNMVSNSWTLDILDAQNIPLVRGIPLVANVDLLAPYPYLNFGGQLIAQTDGSPNIPPTYDNLGANSHLYFVVP